MIQQTHCDALEMLGYDLMWLTSGFLDTEFLEHQITEFREGDDPNPEHYRYAAFLLWINAKESYEDAEISQFLSLLEIDSDRQMSLSAGLVLLQRKGVTDAQFQELSDTIERISEGRMSKVITRERGLRELRKLEHMTLEAFKKYMSLEDSVIQEYLLRNFSGHNEEFLKTLVEKGVARRIRNIASQKLDSLKKRST